MLHKYTYLPYLLQDILLISVSSAVHVHFPVFGSYSVACKQVGNTALKLKMYKNALAVFLMFNVG